MNPINTLGALMVGFAVLASSSAHAQETRAILDQFETGTLPVAEREIPLLIPFAIEWDRMIATEENTRRITLTEQYQALSSPDDGQLRDAMSALAENEEAVEFFTSDETIYAFNEAYKAAKRAGSPIGMIPHDKAMRYWMASRALTTDPQAISDYPRNGPAVQWCLPPLISCNPEESGPEDQ